MALLGAAAALLPACKDPGDPCALRQTPTGQLRDPCSIRCLNLPMNCPDGEYHVNPEVCSGSRCEADADCPADWVCMAFEHDESLRYCTPAEVCE